VGTGANVINLYYTKVTGLSYTVNYLEKGTTNAVSPAKTVGKQTFETVIKSSDEIITVDGYKYDSASATSITIGTGSNVINLYYTKRTDLNYKVNYLEKSTNKILHSQKLQTNVTFKTVITSANEVIAINGYNYASADKTSITVGTGENVINLYYTKRTDLSYTVNYLEKDTNKVIHTVKTQGGKTFEDIVKSADEKIAIDGYNYDSASATSITIGTGSNVINLYYTKRTDLTYKVNYLEKSTNKVIRTQKVKGGMTFQATVTSASEKIAINGYNYDSADVTNITIGTGSNVINLYYTKRTDLSYTVNYLEKGSNTKLHEPKTVSKMTFESTVTSNTEVISIDGYNYNSASATSITIGTGSNVINLYYTKRTDLKYTVNYLEKGTNKVLNTAKVNSTATFGATITATAETIKINGYKYDSASATSITITTGTNVLTLYYTKVTGLSYTVNYLEKGTNTVLHPAKTTGGQTFENVITSSDEVISIDGYKYDSASSATLKIGTGTNVINLYYTKRTDLSYTVNYLEKGTNTVLQKAKVQSGMTFKATVTSASEKVSINGYNYDSASVESITITTGSNVINLYYTKRTDLSYTVNYLEKTTNTVLKTAKVKSGVTFGTVVTAVSEKINIDGYNYIHLC
jgi:uncharacterized protein (UPF0248 family)